MRNWMLIVLRTSPWNTIVEFVESRFPFVNSYFIHAFLKLLWRDLQSGLTVFSFTCTVDLLKLVIEELLLIALLLWCVAVPVVGDFNVRYVHELQPFP